MPTLMPLQATALDGHALSSCDPDRPDADERYACGCFDSSRELRDGLLVTEHSTLMALVRELPPGWQLQ